MVLKSKREKGKRWSDAILGRGKESAVLRVSFSAHRGSAGHTTPAGGEVAAAAAWRCWRKTTRHGPVLGRRGQKWLCRSGIENRNWSGLLG
jgi:hypothetical protein